MLFVVHCGMVKICIAEGCGLKHYARGLCQQHYNRAWREQKLDRHAKRPVHVGCVIEGCRGKHHANGLCAKHANQQWHAEHLEASRARHKAARDARIVEHRAAKRAWSARNPGKESESHYRRKFGQPKELFEQMLRDYGNKCAMCGEHIERLGHSKGVVDHCHCSGKVRGILCSRCNASLGHYEAVRETAERYLQATGDSAAPEPPVLPVVVVGQAADEE
jgi:hypothetical protein